MKHERNANKNLPSRVGNAVNKKLGVRSKGEMSDRRRGSAIGLAAVGLLAISSLAPKVVDVTKDISRVAGETIYDEDTGSTILYREGKPSEDAEFVVDSLSSDGLFLSTQQVGDEIEDFEEKNGKVPIVIVATDRRGLFGNSLNDTIEVYPLIVDAASSNSKANGSVS